MAASAANVFHPISLAESLDSELSFQNAKSASPFRRSISIFSRKGAETPEPTPPFLAQAAMREPKPLSQRQKNWIARRKSVSGSPVSSKSSGSKSPRGTVLHSVPPAKTIHMTALEEEMATNPNEEILSAISDHAPTVDALDGSPQSLSMYHSNWKSKSTTSLTQRTKSTRRKETNTRIGEWRNGVAYWDQGAFDELDESQTSVQKSTGLSHVQPVRMNSRVGAQLVSNRPNLSVAIPGAPLPRNGESTVPTILQPKPHRNFPSVSKARVHQSDEFARHASRSTSPEQEIDLPIMRPPSRPRAPVQSGNANSYGSRSSTASSRSNSQETAPSSRCSSATSFDAIDAAAVANKNKQLPPLPSLTPGYIPYRPCMSVRLSSPPAELPESTKQLRPSRSFSELEAGPDTSFLNAKTPFLTVQTSSPTLSQAEQDLQDHLASIPENARISRALQQARTDSVLDVYDELLLEARPSASASESDVSESEHEDEEIEAPTSVPSRAPTIPKRSRKRDWRDSKNAPAPAAQPPTRRRTESQAKTMHRQAKSGGLRKTASVFQSNQLPGDSSSLSVPSIPCRSSSRSSLSNIISNHAPKQAEAYTERAAKVVEDACSSKSAETVLLCILSALQSPEDLFNTAIISKGMYSVYKSHEMQLIRQVTHNQSPPAAEFREWNPPTSATSASTSPAGSSPASPIPNEYTPQTYLSALRRDTAIIEQLKYLILDRCQTFIRRETALALSSPTHPNAPRFNDAFWRIWCFCSVFGSNKGREDDITGQLDWLKGGLLANNQGCVATVNTNLDFEPSSVLLNAPDHFAHANAAGLSASQLFDMTELWTCMAVLLQGYHGHVEQARQHGIFTNIPDLDPDIEREESILEEWTHHLLTLGPSVILTMSSAPSISAGLTVAQQNNWTTWSLPLYNNSRSNFLKEPVSKLYEEHVHAAHSALADPIEQEKKERSRQRVAALAAEIRIRRQASAYKRSPYIDMHSERAMSIVSRSSTANSTSSRRSSSIPFSPLSPLSLWSGPRARSSISPIIEERERPEPFSQAAYSRYADVEAGNDAERAVKRIVAMGFPPNLARQALRVTEAELEPDAGVRIDRAVNWLLRQ